MKVDAILKYFEEADPAEARVILHVATRTLDSRTPVQGPLKRKKRVMSPEARERIAEAQRKRWAKADKAIA